MRRATIVLALASLCFLVADQAQAAIEVFGAGGRIPAVNTSGTFSSEVNVAANETITDVGVDLLQTYHTWVGDLVATVTHVDTGTSVELLNRPGWPGLFFGYSSDLAGDYGFNDAFAGDFAAAAASSNPIPGGEYAPSQSLAAFAGESSAGTWRLRIDDFAGGDTGSLRGWKLTLGTDSEVIPEPATMVVWSLLFSIVGVGAWWRRKRR